eukprot:g2487.t1
MSISDDSSISPFVLRDGDYSDVSEERNRNREIRKQIAKWFRSFFLRFCFCKVGTRGQSDYNVLMRRGGNLAGSNSVPLPDPRLKPRIPKLLIAFLVLLSLGGILCVYFLVPRGVTLDDPRLEVVEFYLNTPNQSYNLVLNIHLPFYNPNYVGVDISGSVQVTYYQAIAGNTSKNLTIAKRETTNVSVAVNASYVPMEYIPTLLQHCFSFPYQLVFFVDGSFKAKYLLQSQSLSLDTYKYITCPMDGYGFSTEEADAANFPNSRWR